MAIEKYRKKPLERKREESPLTIPTPMDVAEQGYQKAPRTIVGLLGGGLVGAFIGGPIGAILGAVALGSIGAQKDLEEKRRT